MTSATIRHRASSRRLRRRPRTGPTRSRFTPCCCAPCSRPSTRRSTAGTSAWRLTPTPISPARSVATRTCWCTGSSRRFLARPGTSCRCCRRPGEAHAKLSRRLEKGLAARAKSPATSRKKTNAEDHGLAGRRHALQRQRAPRRRGQPRCGGLAQVQVHARASGRGVRWCCHLGHQFRHVRDARCHVCRRPGAHHRTGRRVFPV